MDKNLYIYVKRGDQVNPGEIADIIDLHLSSGFSHQARYLYTEHDYLILLRDNNIDKIVGQVVVDTVNWELNDDLIHEDYRGHGLYKGLLAERLRLVETMFPHKTFYLFTEKDHLIGSHTRSGLTKLPNKVYNVFFGDNGVEYDLSYTGKSDGFHAFFIRANRYRSLFDGL